MNDWKTVTEICMWECTKKVTESFLKVKQSAQSNLTLCLCLSEGSQIFNENETYPRALLHWTRAAAQG